MSEELTKNSKGTFSTLTTAYPTSTLNSVPPQATFSPTFATLSASWIPGSTVGVTNTRIKVQELSGPRRLREVKIFAIPSPLQG